jgi:hypothetical protein
MQILIHMEQTTTQPKSETNALTQKNEQLTITAFVGPSVKRREIPMRPIPINELIEMRCTPLTGQF